jgi:hypothetical protein
MPVLFLDTPLELSKRIDRLIEHLRRAEEMHPGRRPGRTPSMIDSLWVLLQDAMETARRTPDVERRRLGSMKGSWPTARVDAIEDFVARLSRLQQGLPEFEATEVRVAVSEAAVDRMVDVLDLLRFVRQDRDATRPLRVVLARAAGLSLEQCGRVWDRSRAQPLDRRAFHDMKTRILGRIAKGMADEFGLLRAGGDFQRLSFREIEERDNCRQQVEKARAQRRGVAA